jgi:predicted transcriptional regulator
MSYFAQERYEATRPLPIYKLDPRQTGLRRWLGSLEEPIMLQVWAADFPRTVKRVWTDLKREGATQQYTTVMTTMSRLWEKGMLDRRRSGLAYVYTPRETREQFEARQIAAAQECLEVASLASN